MSNRISLVGTEFKNVTSNSTTYGYCMYDSYDATYNNCLEKVQVKNDLRLLELVVELGDNSCEAMISHMIENETGIEINDTWYDYDEIKDTIT